MSNRKAPLEMEILSTLDGSPTVSLREGEKMHSMDGALSETHFIYGPIIDKALQEEKSHILSVGLGLGYNEILSCAKALAIQKDQLQILSFEIEDQLIECFKNWALGKELSALTKSYDFIALEISKKLNLPPLDIKNSVASKLLSEDLKILGALSFKNPTAIQYNGILYDAFSSNTDSELWDQENLELFLSEYCLQKCYFSTYAATGNLKRALLAKNFQLDIKKGFARKRQSTFAYRN